MSDEGEISAAKALLRRQLRAARDAIAAEQRSRRSLALCQCVWRVLGQRAAPMATIATYSPIGSEVNVGLLHDVAPPGAAVQWAYPRVAGKDIHFHLGAPTVPGPWNIAEPAATAPLIDPSDLNVVIVPGLGFDLHGHRLGYGAGYYDRALAQTKATTLFIAVCFREQVVPMIPTTHRDHPLHVLVTEDEQGVAMARSFGATL